MQPLVSICIACHNQAHLIGEAIVSILKQDYKNIEVIVLDDASTDDLKTSWIFCMPQVKYFRSDEPSGTGGAFNKAMEKATGKYIYLLCSDDIITDTHVISDTVNIFEDKPLVGHVSRWYHQFVDGDRSPVRAWRTDDVVEQANNPSGMAFRKTALANPLGGDFKLTNKMFAEVSFLVNDVLNQGWKWDILKYDTISVRVHASISQNKEYYLKRWVSSPIENWLEVGGKNLLKDYTSFIQIKNNYKTSAVLKEIYNFIRLRPLNLLAIGFWFYAIVSLLTPRRVLRKLPHIYRKTLGRWTTREVKRCQR